MLYGKSFGKRWGLGRCLRGAKTSGKLRGSSPHFHDEYGTNLTSTPKWWLTHMEIICHYGLV